MQKVFIFIFFFFLINSTIYAQTNVRTNPNTIEITADELRSGLYGYDLFGVLKALSIQTGITLKSSSDVGSEDWLLVRGYPRDSGRNILVLIDGMPLNDGLSGANEFEHLPPIELIEKIIIYKAPLPSRFGGAHAAIEIITKREIQRSKSELEGAYGEYKSGFASGWTEGTTGNFSYFAMVDFLRTDNLTGVQRTSPKENIVYGDRSYKIIKPVAKFSYKLSENSRISLLSQFVESKKFFSDEIFRDEREFRDRKLTSFNLNYIWNPTGNFNLTAAMFRTDESYKLNLKQHPSVRDQKRVVQGVKVDAIVALPYKQTLFIGGNFTDVNTEEKSGQPLKINNVNIIGLYIEDQINPFSNIWFTIGLRYDDHSQGKSTLNPNILIVYNPMPKLTLHGQWSRSTRWPGLSEFNTKNPQRGLQGEKMEGFELGASYYIVSRKFSTKITYFDLTLKDESILFMNFMKFPPEVYYTNATDKIESRGVETELRVVFSDRWSGFMNYTYNLVRRQPSDKPINFGAPKNLLNAGINFAGKLASAQLLLRYGGKASGVQAMGGPPTELDDWIVLDIAGTIRLNNGLSIFSRVANINNAKYETFDGRPMFGRTAIAGLKVQF